MLPARFNKTAISLFIVLSLAAQMLRNLNAGYLPDDPGAPGAIRYAVWLLNYEQWGIRQYGWHTGLNGYWRMFSPVHHYNWRHVIQAVYPDGSLAALPLPNQTQRTFWQTYFVDFRETKMLLNMWSRPPMKAAYAEHLCRTYPVRGRSPAFIRYELFWQGILTPEQAAQMGTHLDAAVQSAVIGEYACQP